MKREYGFLALLVYLTDNNALSLIGKCVQTWINFWERRIDHLQNRTCGIWHCVCVWTSLSWGFTYRKNTAQIFVFCISTICSRFSVCLSDRQFVLLFFQLLYIHNKKGHSFFVYIPIFCLGNHLTHRLMKILIFSEQLADLYYSNWEYGSFCDLERSLISICWDNKWNEKQQ